jgi:peroxiredoxin
MKWGIQSTTKPGTEKSFFSALKNLRSALLLCLASSTLVVHAQKYLIRGHLTGFANGTKFYLTDLSTFKDIDSATIRNDRFIMAGALTDPPSSLLISLSTFSHPFAIPNPNAGSAYIPLLIGNDTVEIEGDISALPFDVSVKGSKIQDQENELNLMLNANNKRIRALKETMMHLKNKKDSAVLFRNIRESAELERRNSQLRKEYGLKHLNTYSGLKALQPFAIGTDTLQYIYDHLSTELKNWVFGRRLANYLRSKKELKIGDNVSDLKLVDMKGAVRHLFDFKGGYMLLYFYTSNCPLCNQQLYDLQNIYNNYRQKITIVAVSTDSTKHAWLNTTGKTMPWQTYWAATQDNPEIMERYGPYLSPAYFLVDPQGRILYTHLGFSATSDNKGPLEQIIENIIKGK